MRSRSIVVRALVGPRPAASAIRRTTVSEIAAFRAPPSGECGPAIDGMRSSSPLWKVGLAPERKEAANTPTARVPVALRAEAPRRGRSNPSVQVGTARQIVRSHAAYHAEPSP